METGANYFKSEVTRTGKVTLFDSAKKKSFKYLRAIQHATLNIGLIDKYSRKPFKMKFK